jgi:hypothetical protein
MSTQTDLLTAKECADYRRCHVRTLERERELGNGCPYVRIGGRIYYRRSDIDQFIAAHVCGGDVARRLNELTGNTSRKIA